MSPAQVNKVQELSQILSQGKASPKQIQQLSALLAKINRYDEVNSLAECAQVISDSAPQLV